jgi:hypothetical protein
LKSNILDAVNCPGNNLPIALPDIKFTGGFEMNMTTTHHTIKITNNFRLTQHAWERMGARGFSSEKINKVLSFGRVIHTRGASIYVIGRKEINHYENQGINLNGLNGVQVICTKGGAIMTMYRNRDFRSLKPRSRTPHRLHN